MDEFFIQFGAIFVVYNKSMIKNLLSILLITIIFFQSCVPARKFEEISEKQEVCAVELKTLKKENANNTIWVIGGPNIIEQTIETIEEFYLSRIPGEYGCDGFLSLENIERLFKKTWFEKHEEVEFQIWKKVK